MKNKKYKLGLPALAMVAIVVTAAFYLHAHPVAVLSPKGPIAYKERQLIIITSLLSLIVVVPVFSLLFTFAWRYREGNTKAKYSPNLAGNRIAETVWWLVPSILITVLGFIIWHSTYELDPYRPIASRTPSLPIEVVALDWKWLFIYPEQHIASVNFVQFPARTPVTFEITSDAPMNSFWIPQLGGQIYAMPGMSTELNLMADSNGNFHGSSANISGSGFAGMAFIARASSPAAFGQWVNAAKRSPQQLTLAAYDKLTAPSQYNPVSYYSSPAAGLYNSIIMKYMAPVTAPAGKSGTPSMSNMSGMNMEMQ